MSTDTVSPVRQRMIAAIACSLRHRARRNLGPGAAARVCSRGPRRIHNPLVSQDYLSAPAGQLAEFVCAESTRDYVGRTIDLPHADKPDF